MGGLKYEYIVPYRDKETGCCWLFLSLFLLIISLENVGKMLTTSQTIYIFLLFTGTFYDYPKNGPCDLT